LGDSGGFFAAGVTGVDSYSYTFTATGTTFQIARESGATDVRIDNVSIRKVSQPIQYRKWVGTSEVQESRVHTMYLTHADYEDWNTAEKIISDTTHWDLKYPDCPPVGYVYQETTDEVIGTLTLPSESNVLTGSGTYGVSGTGSTPSYSPDFPAVGNVIETDTVDDEAGTLTLPSVGNVIEAVVYGVAGTGSTGTYHETAASEVVAGVTFGPGESYTGTYVSVTADITIEDVKVDLI